MRQTTFRRSPPRCWGQGSASASTGPGVPGSLRFCSSWPSPSRGRMRTRSGTTPGSPSRSRSTRPSSHCSPASPVPTQESRCDRCCAGLVPEGPAGSSPDAAFGLHEQLIRITPHPVLAPFVRGYERVVGGVVVARGVVVLRVVTAAQVSAGHAEAKVNPLVARGQALFAPLRRIRPGRLHLVEMRASSLCHRVRLPTYQLSAHLLHDLLTTVADVMPSSRLPRSTYSRSFRQPDQLRCRARSRAATAS